MDLKLLLLTVIWRAVNSENEFTKDIYELEFWSRAPVNSNNRRSYMTFRNGVARPFFRNDKIKSMGNGTTDGGRRIRKPQPREADLVVTAAHKSTRIDPSPMHLVKQKNIRTDNNNKSALRQKEESEDSSEVISVYSLKTYLENIVKEDLLSETNVTVDVLARTFEYNDIILLKMAEKNSDPTKYFRTNDNKYMDESPEKKILFIVHGLSTRGMLDLPCLSVRSQFLQLLKHYLKHLDKFDIYLMPMANPDGFTKMVYDRAWNKNMSPQSSCKGVALDRNFDVAWSSSVSVGPCSRNYPGPSPFSEPETRAVRDVFHRYGHKIAAYINVHGASYITETLKGEAVLYPKGYTDVQSDDDKYMDMKGEIDEVMRNASFQRMTVNTEPLHQWYGKVTGTSVDYAATVFGIPFALEFVMETYKSSSVQKAALSAVWMKLIDTVFNFIHKRGDGSEAQNR